MRSATLRGLARKRFTNFTTGSKTGPPPWSVPMSVNTKDPDISTSDPYVSGERYAAESAATPPNDEPSARRPARAPRARGRAGAGGARRPGGRSGRGEEGGGGSPGGPRPTPAAGAVR